MVSYVDVVTEAEFEPQSYFLLFNASYETSDPDATIPAKGNAGAFVQYKLTLAPENLRIEDVAEQSVNAPGVRIRVGAIAMNDDELARLR